MFEALKKRLKRIEKINVNSVMKKSLSGKSLQMDIISLNTDDQLYEKGIDSIGDQLGDYSPATIEGVPGRFKGKIEKGQRYDHITLSDSGDFYRSWRFKNESNEFYFVANAIKEGTDLAQFYGKDILGLTNENIKQTAEWVRPIFLNILRENIFK